MNDKDAPKKCEAKLCCRATAQLQLQVEREKSVPDPDKKSCASLDEFIESISQQTGDQDGNKVS